MPPEQVLKFGLGATATVLHPCVVVAMILATTLMLFLPRKYVVVPFLFVTLMAPLGQQVVLGGVHWFVFRILIVCGWVRLLFGKSTLRSGIFAGGINAVDRAFFCCTVVGAVAVVLRFLEAAALTNQCGMLIDHLGGYFLLRALIRSEEDVCRTIKCLALISLAVAIGMEIEQLKLINVFGLLGGQRIFPEIREGRIRSVGPFGHEILAGTLGATLLPLFLLLWKGTRAKITATLGIVGATGMMVTSNSSTALLAYVGGILAICFWPLRRKMRFVRRGMVVGLLALQLVMKAPFWFVIAHINLVPGSSSWHRAAIVDQCIMHFTDWWLIGTKNAGEWGFWMWDTQNQFVSIAQGGGLASLIFFILMISRCFGSLGTARRAVHGIHKNQWFLWFLGAALFSHVTGFFGVNYFDQTVFAWFALLAMISAATALCRQSGVRAHVAEFPAADTSQEQASSAGAR